MSNLLWVHKKINERNQFSIPVDEKKQTKNQKGAVKQWDRRYKRASKYMYPKQIK